MEFLSNSSWINPQIDFLLFLQNLRIQTGGIFDNAFLSLTKFGEVLFPTLFMCVVYWCFDFRAGQFMFLVNSVSFTCMQILKNIACIYRPWILSEAIKPSPLAIKAATGYSFPSGHTMTASTVWGSTAFLTRKKPLICVSLIFLVLLVGFSRLYLGVHTPQDVLVGLLTGCVLIFTVNPLINWCEKNINRYLYVLLVANILILLSMYFVLTKHYPIDYIDGKLLVDPRKAMNVAISFYGWSLGLLNGTILCRRFFPFNPKIGTKTSKIARAVIGIVTTVFLFEFIEKYVFVDGADYKFKMTVMIFAGFYVTALYPLLFSKVFKKYLAPETVH